MKFTDEQHRIIHSTGNIRINAVAGSGKTTTIIEYARRQPPKSKILYIAFNKSVRLEAEQKFIQRGLGNVTVKTAHALAFDAIIRRRGYTVAPRGYRAHEIAEILQLQGTPGSHYPHILAHHVSRFAAFFCNSRAGKVRELDYFQTVHEGRARAFVRAHYDTIEYETRRFLGAMDSKHIACTHDFYLKKFQIICPVLPYDCILFDEGQDASPAMLDVFLKQKATRVIVGDTHQQIYGWRFAVNSLEEVDFPGHFLSASFRFSQDVADLSMAILHWKSHLSCSSNLYIRGAGGTATVKSRAVIARTNLGLLLKAMEYAVKKRSVKKIYFEGHISSYTYASDGASLYDVLHLYEGKREKIRDRIIRTLADLAEVAAYAKKTGDMELAMMHDIVKKYGTRIYHIIKTLREKHVKEGAKSSADLVFSTVHRCKGMEYDSVELAQDFITEEKIQQSVRENPGDRAMIHMLREEINLLYVAVTRTRNLLAVPDVYIPADMPPSPQIRILKSSRKLPFKYRGVLSEKRRKKKRT
jgi:superfamily I DNA/RNA helicase